MTSRFPLWRKKQSVAIRGGFAWNGSYDDNGNMWLKVKGIYAVWNENFKWKKCLRFSIKLQKL